MESLQRFPHRRAPEADPLRQVVLRQAGAGRQIEPHNHVLDGPVGLLGQRPGLVRAR